MRAKAHRYSTTVPAATFTSGTDVVGVTGDFDGGFAEANVHISAGPGVGNYIVAQFKVDGQAQGPSYGVYQAVGTFLNLAFSQSLRVPQGRHRISVAFTTNAAPIASCTADLNVAELPA